MAVSPSCHPTLVQRTLISLARPREALTYTHPEQGKRSGLDQTA